MCEQSLSFITTTKSHVCNGHKFAKNVNNVRFGWDGTGCGDWVCSDMTTIKITKDSEPMKVF